MFTKFAADITFSDIEEFCKGYDEVRGYGWNTNERFSIFLKSFRLLLIQWVGFSLLV